MRAKRPKVAARIFLLHPFLSFSRERIGSALQGVLQPPLILRGTPRDPRGGGLVPATIFVSDDIFVVKMHDL